jgi:hypothetical protein
VVDTMNAGRETSSGLVSSRTSNDVLGMNMLATVRYGDGSGRCVLPGSSMRDKSVTAW